MWGPFLENEVVKAAYLLDCNFMPSCKHISLVGTETMQVSMERLASDGYDYTRGYGSGRVVILSTGRVRGRLTALCYGYGSGSKTAVPADL